MKPSHLPSKKYLESVFCYWPASGLLYWRHRPQMRAEWNTRYAFKLAGAVKANGYLSVSLDKKDFLVHRIIFKMMTGKNPRAEIDHRDGRRSNNRWRNLREATRGQNSVNCPIKRHNRCGYKGVTFHAETGKWRARIRANNVIHSLGLFDTAASANLAYNLAATVLHGEFANV